MASEDILLPDEATEPLPVIYEEIDAEKVHKAALKLQGSGGPSLMDADGWRHILCSKSYGKVSVNLCQAIADLAKKLCREDVHPDSLKEFVACKKWLEKWNIDMSNPEAQFKKADSDGKGMVLFSEFSHWAIQ